MVKFNLLEQLLFIVGTAINWVADRLFSAGDTLIDIAWYLREKRTLKERK
jgi:hypothetical protein